MKTTKKGFTLIELIVVIAIIGVLAAILVPAMLGYVKKSKIQSANSAAATILKACNSALAELDEIDDSVNDGTLTITGGVGSYAAALSNSEAGPKIVEYMGSYFDGMSSCNAQIRVTNGVATYCAAVSGAYVGTSPAAFTAKTYESTVGSGDTSAKLSAAFTAASSAYAKKHSVANT